MFVFSDSSNALSPREPINRLIALRGLTASDAGTPLIAFVIMKYVRGFGN